MKTSLKLMVCALTLVVCQPTVQALSYEKARSAMSDCAKAVRQNALPVLGAVAMIGGVIAFGVLAINLDFTMTDEQRLAWLEWIYPSIKGEYESKRCLMMISELNRKILMKKVA